MKQVSASVASDQQPGPIMMFKASAGKTPKARTLISEKLLSPSTQLTTVGDQLL